jgi:hemoglobin/transferrin/lactoferrin receptor protein
MDPDDDAIFREDNPDTMVYGLSEDNWSPKLGVLYNASDNLSLFAQYARGFRSPPFDDVNIGFTIPAFGFEAIPNPDLRPETSDGIELGTRYNGDYSFFSASAWYNDYEDLIESRVNLGVDPDTGLLTFQSLNRAEATIYGADLRYRVDLAGLSPMLDGFTMRANLAWARGDDDDRDEPLNTVDPAKAVLGLDYDHSNGRWGASLMLTGVASKDRVDDSMGPVFEPDGYGVVDVFGFLRLGERSRLNWGVFNLSDKKYWVWSDVRSMPAGDPLLPYHTRPGRNVSVSLSFNL